MFKLKIDLQKGVIAAVGPVADIATDVLFVISEIHAAFAKQDPVTAEVFRLAMVHGIADSDSPCFSGESSPGVTFLNRIRKDGEKQ